MLRTESWVRLRERYLVSEMATVEEIARRIAREAPPNPWPSRAQREAIAAEKKSKLPTRKVTAGALAGGATTVAAWALLEFWQIALPVETATAATVVLTFIASYLVPES